MPAKVLKCWPVGGFRLPYRMSLLLALLALLGTVRGVSIAEKRATCNTYVVPGITGGFTKRVFADFSTARSGGDVVDLLSSYGISISDYSIADTPVPRTFTPNNVKLGDGTLDLMVSAYTGSGDIQSSEIVTDDTFTYASVRTVLKSSPTPGIVEGNFFYLNDNQEIDFEILTTTTLTPSPDVPAGIWATNQATTPGGTETDQTIPFTFDPSSGFHEYRIDWTSAATTFYIDGVQKARFTTNVPTLAGHWIWNSWSNGDPEWSNGPPTANAVTQIQSMDIYTGYTTTASGTLCNI